MATREAIRQASSTLISVASAVDLKPASVAAATCEPIRQHEPTQIGEASAVAI